jgi:hypothetical protein
MVDDLALRQAMAWQIILDFVLNRAAIEPTHYSSRIDGLLLPC